MQLMSSFLRGEESSAVIRKRSCFRNFSKCPPKWGSYDKSTVPCQSKERALETFLSSSLQTPIFAAPVTQMNALFYQNTLTGLFNTARMHSKAGANSVQEIIKSMYYPRFLGNRVQ